MKESFWAVMIVGLGITSIFLVYFFQTVTNTSEHNYELLKETTEAAMFDALDLASYRELEAFTQFGSDLDPMTKKKLERGKRTIEVLKQDLNKPLKVEKQVVSLYALTRGFLDDIPVADIRRFEGELLNWLDTNHTNIYEHIRNTKDLPADADMAEAINAFKKTFAKSE